MASKEGKYQDFIDMTRSELVDYLGVRGLGSTGNKAMLVSQAFVAWESNVPVKLSQEALASKIKVEYLSMLKQHNILDPLAPQNYFWSDDVTKWPSVNLGNIFGFILEQNKFNVDYIGKYKARRAYSYFQSNYVGPVSFATVDNGDTVCILKSSVTPSLAIHDEVRQNWILMKTTGEIVTAWCSCTAGFGKTCNHIIATLYKIEYAITNELNKVSCTAESCRWNASTMKSVQPRLVSDMDFRTDDVLSAQRQDRRKSTEAKIDFDPRREGEDTGKPEAISNFLERLVVLSPKSVLLTGLSGQLGSQITPDLPPNLISLGEGFRDFNLTRDASEVASGFCETLNLTAAERSVIEEATRNPQHAFG